MKFRTPSFRIQRFYQVKLVLVKIIKFITLAISLAGEANDRKASPHNYRENLQFCPVMYQAPGLHACLFP